MDALANWLWQGGAVALAATIILRAFRRMSATTRYSLWWVALAAVLALPVLPWLTTTLTTSPPLDSIGARTAVVAPSGAVAAMPESTPGVILPAPPAWLPVMLFALWSVWLFVSVARTAAAFISLQRIRREAQRFPVTREQRLPTWLSVRACGRRVGLALSNRVRAAAVLGLASPTIAVAPHALEALDDTELDQIVVHEWAHVQRRDDVARLIQRIVVAVAGFHPAVWWIDRQLSLERETACDDWAIKAAGSGRSLAVCLTKLASLPGTESSAVLMPAALLPSELSTRVTRLLDVRRNTSTTRTLGVPMIVATALSAIALTVAGVELVATAPRPSEHDVSRLQPEATGTPVSSLPPSAGTESAAADRRSIGRGRSSGRSERDRQKSTAASAPQPPAQAEPVRQSEPARTAASAGARDIVPAHAIAEAPLDAGALPGTITNLPAALLSATPPAAAAPSKPPTPWGAAASAGVTAGKSSQKAAVATAGFFTRLSKSISGAF